MHKFLMPTKCFHIHFSNIAYNLKSMNSSVQEHAQCRQITKFHSHKIKMISQKVVAQKLFTLLSLSRLIPFTMLIIDLRKT